MSVAARGDGDHFELPADAVELLRQVRPADRQGFIEEITQALAAAAETKDFRPLQDVLEAWTAAVRLQRQPGYEAMIERMQRRAWPARGPRRATSPSRLAVRWRIEQAEAERVGRIAVASRGPHTPHRNQHARTFDVAGADGVAQADVEEVGAA